MPDITDQDRRAARQWAEDIYEMSKYDDETPRETRAAAKCILANVDAPEPTLAEELREQASWAEGMGGPVHGAKFRALAARVDQMERDLTEARAEVERLTAERQEETMRHVNEQYADLPVRDRDWFDRNGNPDPADVKPGEAWIVEFYEEKRTALKDGDDITPWNTVNTGGRLSCVRNEDVTLIARLVPAPRVITDPHDLDRLPRHTAILSADNDAWQKSSETSLWASAWWTTSDGEPSMWASDRLCDEDHPATVLWEPEA